MIRHKKPGMLPWVAPAALALFAAPSAAAPAPDTTRSGETLTRQTCLQCHGNGHKVGPDLARQKLDYPTIRYIVRHGLNAMPAFRETELSDAELRAIALYLAGQHGKISGTKGHP